MNSTAIKMYPAMTIGLPVGSANPKSLELEIVQEIRDLVRIGTITSVNSYKGIIRAAHAYGVLKKFPVEASKFCKMSWNDLLFGGCKFATYEEAIESCIELQIDNKKDYLALPRALRNQHRLPSEMTYYPAFPGWVKFKSNRRPSLSGLRSYCYLNKIVSLNNYRSFASSAEGRALFIPKYEYAPLAYGSEWRGWEKVLLPVSMPVTIESRVRKIEMRNSKKAQKSGG